MEYDVRVLLEICQVNTRQRASDQENRRVRTALRQLFDQCIVDALLQHADKAVDRMRQILHVLRAGKGVLLGLYAREDLVSRAVRDHLGGRVDLFQCLCQTDRGCEYLIGRLGQIVLHLVHNLGIDVTLVRGMTVYTVVYQLGVRQVLHNVARGRRVAPQYGLVAEAVLAHLFADERRLPLLVNFVDPAEFVEKRQYRRQCVHGDIFVSLDFFAGLLVFFDICGGFFVLERCDHGHRRIKIQDFAVAQTAHHVLLARRQRMVVRCRKTDDVVLHIYITPLVDCFIIYRRAGCSQTAVVSGMQMVKTAG